MPSVFRDGGFKMFCSLRLVITPWKMIFLFNCVIFRFHVDLPGSKYILMVCIFIFGPLFPNLGPAAALNVQHVIVQIWNFTTRGGLWNPRVDCRE